MANKHTGGNQGGQKQQSRQLPVSSENRRTLRSLVQDLDKGNFKWTVVLFLLAGVLQFAPWGIGLMGIAINYELGLLVLAVSVLMFIAATCMLWSLHRATAWALLIFGLLAIGWFNRQLLKSCHATITATPEAVSRIYVGGNIPSVGPREKKETYFHVNLQELFYDWTLTIVSNCDVEQLTINVKDHINPRDRVRFEPEGSGTISEYVPQWMSGFEEPSRKPDVFVRTIHLVNVRDGAEYKVVFRRPIYIVSGQLTQSYLERSIETEKPRRRFTVIEPSPMTVADFNSVISNLATLSTRQYSGPNEPAPPIRANPDAPLPPLLPGEAAATSEVKCQDKSCTKVIISGIEARAER